MTLLLALVSTAATAYKTRDYGEVTEISANHGSIYQDRIKQGRKGFSHKKASSA